MKDARLPHTTNLKSSSDRLAIYLHNVGCCFGLHNTSHPACTCDHPKKGAFLLSNKKNARRGPAYHDAPDMRHDGAWRAAARHSDAYTACIELDASEQRGDDGRSAANLPAR